MLTLFKKADADIPITITDVPAGRTVEKVYLAVKQNASIADGSAHLLLNTEAVDTDESSHTATCTISIDTDDLDDAPVGACRWFVKCKLDNDKWHTGTALTGECKIEFAGIEAIV